MKNNFPQWVFDLFDNGGWFPSWESDCNADCLHHVMGRISSSPYNACPLNNFRDHLPEGRTNLNLKGINSPEMRVKYLNKTKKYLDKAGYEPKKKDLKFLEDNKKYYENKTSSKI